MKITLKELSITNFKGIRHQVIKPGSITNIYGKNEAGKTSLYDAFLWLLFDKDSSDRKTFSIKNTVDTSLNRADHEVYAVLDIDGRTVTLKKIYKEKWEKKRGAAQAEFTGHKADFFWNDVPCTLAEFQQRLSELIKEEQFKLITNTRYFNEVLTWQRRRDCLLQIAGDISNEEIAATLPKDRDYTGMLKMLSEEKSIDDIRKQNNAQKKKIRESLDQIPARIDELRRSIAEVPNFSSIEPELSAKQRELSTIESSLLNSAQALAEKQESQRKLIQQKYDLQSQQDAIRNGHRERLLADDRNSRSEISQLQEDIVRTNKELSRLNDDAFLAKSLITNATNKQAALKDAWYKVDEETFQFDESACTCAYCKQPLPNIDISENKKNALAAFNLTKSERKNAITAEGKALGDTIASTQQDLSDISSKIESVSAKLKQQEDMLRALEASFIQPRPIDERISDAISSDESFTKLVMKIHSLQDQIQEVPTVDNTELLDKKKSLITEIDAFKGQLAKKDAIAAAEKRIAELLEDEKRYSQEIVDLEQIEFAVEQFNKAKMDLMESRIAGKFQHVTFKLFDRQINAGEKETCETLWDGVPYADLNNAGKVQAGLDIINTLSSEFNTCAPIFIDNRESVTWIPETQSQVINLIVSPSDETLRVESDRISNTLFA